MKTTLNKTLYGGCLCKAIRYQVSYLPFATEYCHCSMCQKISGAPVMGWMDFKVEQVMWLKGTPKEYASSEFVRRGFCEQCGSCLSFRDVNYPKFLTITINSLDNASLVAPEKHIFIADKCSWLNIDDELPRYRLGPSSGKLES